MEEVGTVWTWVMIGAVAAVPLAMLVVLWKGVSRKRELTSATATLRDLERMPEEAAANDALWRGDKLYRTNVPFEEMERRLGEALDVRRFTQGFVQRRVK